MNTFEECCEYLGISTELPRCQIRERQLQAEYKLSVCMMAWNKADGFVPNEKAHFYQKEGGYVPHFNLENGSLHSSGNAATGSSTGIVFAYAYTNNEISYTSAHFGLRLPLKTYERAVDFGKTFLDIFNELI